VSINPLITSNLTVRLLVVMPDVKISTYKIH
jgi:hypothetical protein